MTTLIEKLQASVGDWRSANFPHGDYPAIAEILEWAAEPKGSGFRLRTPQLRALEVYGFLRLIEGTPKISDIYEKYFPAVEEPVALLNALGIPKVPKKDSLTLKRVLALREAQAKRAKELMKRAPSLEAQQHKELLMAKCNTH